LTAEGLFGGVFPEDGSHKGCAHRKIKKQRLFFVDSVDNFVDIPPEITLQNIFFVE